MGIDRKLKRRTLEDKDITENKMEFIYQMYLRNPSMLTEDYKKKLVDYGYIDNNKITLSVSDADKEEFPSNINHAKRDDDFNFGKIAGQYHHSGEEITTDMWMPESLIKHTDEFFNWINSMLYDGFQNKTDYKPLQIYIQQAHNWLSEEDSMNNYYSEEEKIIYARQEFERCKQNSLYWLDKYVKLFESDMLDETSRDYIAKPVHEVMAFMFDCGYNHIVGKPRQIAATTTYEALALKRLVFNKNTFVKFITMDVDSAEEILEQKLKYPVSELPNWLRPSVSSDSAKGIKFGRKVKGKKGVRGGANSKFHVVAPSVSAVNGGAPSLVLVDEAAYIRMLIKMILEARPTMFRQDPSTGQIKMLRQVIIWGTGGVDEKEVRTKSKDYEELFITILDKWKKKQFDYGIVPVFFDWTTRPGMTYEFYEKEKLNYTVEGPEADARMNQFRLTYPSRIEDMFLDSSKTLIPISYIEARENELRKLDYKARPQYGYFEPEYDLSSKSDDNNDLPYKLIGAKWIPVEDQYDRRASACVFMHPEKNWRNRYFKGTDPIAQDNGFSNMASAIFDAKINTISAIVNYRDDDHRNTFLQNLLLGLYYGVEGQNTPTLIEANIGTSYYDYISNKGFERSVMLNGELIPSLQGGQNTFGLDNRGNRNRVIIDKGYELIHNYGERICIEDLWKQLRTFTCTISQAGKETWGTTNARKYHDDVFFAATFAYICRISYSYLEPYDIVQKDGGHKMVSKLVRLADGTLTNVNYRKKIE